MCMLCDKIEKVDLPFFLEAMGTDWIAEEKFDGDRVRMRVKNGKISLFNRRGIEVTERYPEFFGVNIDRDMFLDGEMCVLDANGLSQFNEGIAFRTHCKNEDSIFEAAEAYPVTFVIFDILEIDNNDIKDTAWTERRKQLETLDLKGPFKISQVNSDIMQMWDYVTKRGGEGIILKRKSAFYFEGRRSSNWRKVKDIKEADIIVTKYTVNPKGIRVETDEGIACQVSGYNAPPVQEILDKNGEAEITIRHLGWTGKRYRQPTYMKLVH